MEREGERERGALDGPRTPSPVSAMYPRCSTPSPTPVIDPFSSTQVVHTQALKLVSVEEDMLRLLAGKDWEDQRTAKSLLQLNKAREDAQERSSASTFHFQLYLAVYCVHLPPCADICICVQYIHMHHITVSICTCTYS